MTFSVDFKKEISQMIADFLQETKNNSYKLITQETGLLSEHPQDFNFGHGLGYLEGIISTNFLSQYGREMTLKENMEMRDEIAKIAIKYKELIFKGGI